jgi:Helix-turn-helix domain
MPPDIQALAGPDIEAMAEQVFTALADPTRRAILAALASGGPATATDLAGRLPITRQAVAKHLALLAGAGLVTAEPGGAAPGPLPAAVGSDAGGAAVPGRAGPRLGRPSGRAEEPPGPGYSRALPNPTGPNPRTSWLITD